MAFWGVEVKPGNPVIHSPKNACRRLRVTRATLGSGSATEKIHVMCKVGEAGSPTFLCILVPGKHESTFLDLIFEEAEDVIFSVIGPTSVHLSGYYMHGFPLERDAKPYGINIENVSSKDPSWHSEENKYGGNFIDDSKLPDSAPSLDFHKKDTEEKSANEDGMCGMEWKEVVPPVEPTSGVKIPSHEDETKVEDEKNKLPKQLATFVNNDEGLTYLNMAENKVENNIVSQSTVLEQNSNEQILTPNIPKGDEKKRKAYKEEEETCIFEEMGHYKKEDSLCCMELEEKVASVTSIHKSTSPDELMTEILVNGPPDRKIDAPEKSDNKKEDVVCCVEMKEKVASLDISDEQTSYPEKRTRKRMKKNTQDEGNTSVNFHTMTDIQGASLIKYENESADVTQIPIGDSSDGLTIEVLVNGPLDGKVAVPGKKVKLYYTGMLKESGRIFDSNEGKRAFKFRLGDEEYIDGWNLGIDGMRVGEKRRLTIPPSLGFGEHGNGEKVPPNSWLVYEVELVGVYK